ncbi:MAG TPA: hypothetical protein PKD96_04265, partial [Candidatus Absconditabacterales bacterium]|nr:hypothetical protein [Candidatus Absconditabacterales bacterium]
MKGNIGLVGEKGVKSKIEQLTQRTWEVNPFDSLKITRNPTPLQGMDIRVDTFVNLRFNFDQVYAVIKSIADGVNQRTEKPGKILESKINEGSRNLNKFYQDQIQDPLQQNVDINITSFDYKPGKYDSDDLSFDYGALYESGKNDDYQTVKNTLKKELKILATKVEGQAQTNKLKALMDEVNYQSDVEPNREGVARVYQTLAEDVRTYQKNLSETNQTIKKSYDDFLNGLQKNKLVADHDEEKNYSAPLFTTKDKTLDLLNQPHPEKTYLELNAQMVSGYKAALSRYSAVQLSMDDGTYQKAKTYVSELDRDVHQALIAYGDQQAPLLAQGATTTSSTISSASSQSSFG